MLQGSSEIFSTLFLLNMYSIWILALDNCYSFGQHSFPRVPQGSSLPHPSFYSTTMYFFSCINKPPRFCLIYIYCILRYRHICPLSSSLALVSVSICCSLCRIFICNWLSRVSNISKFNKRSTNNTKLCNSTAESLRNPLLSPGQLNKQASLISIIYNFGGSVKSGCK